MYFRKELLREQMKELGVGVTEMADMLGIHRASLHRKLKGERDFTYTELTVLFKLFGEDIFRAIFFTQSVA